MWLKCFAVLLFCCDFAVIFILFSSYRPTLLVCVCAFVTYSIQFISIQFNSNSGNVAHKNMTDRWTDRQKADRKNSTTLF